MSLFIQTKSAVDGCNSFMPNTDERTFILRFSLSAEIPPEAWEDEDFDGDEWLDEWESQIKPGLVRAILTHLRTFEGWSCHIRNRGVSPVDEIEVVARKSWDKNGVGKQ